jgi:DNA-binding winged helix-turn-helix (wHTH) protein/tetratricopeptide (TPR) repeat protein
LKKSHRLAPDSPAGNPAAPGSAPPESREAQSYAFGPFRLLPEERVLRRGGRSVPLPPKAFDTLLLLVRNPGHLMLKEDLMQALWPDTFVEEVNLANKVSLLRRVLDDTDSTARSIQTVPKLGYRFLPAVTRVWKAAPAPDAGVSAAEEPEERAIRFIALPFTMAGGDERIAFLAHSLPEAISGSLAGLRSLTVRSSLLAERLAEGGQDPRRIGREADVDMVLAGTILSDGERLRVNAELIQAGSGTLVGSYVCQAARENIFEIQDSLVRRIVELLAPRLTPHERRSLAHDVPASAHAYEFYLRGTHVERQRTFENMSMARDLYRQSLDADPDFAPAWARLGRCYRFLEKFDPQGARDTELTQWAFRRAFALNPDLPMAHNHYTQIEADAGHAPKAMVRLLGQAEKHPNDPELFTGLVQATRYCGLLEESLRAHQRARSLDARTVTSVAHTYFLLGDYERTLEWYPPGSRFYLDAAVMAVTGREADAAQLLEDRSLLAPLVESLRFCLQGDHASSIGVAMRAIESETPDPEIRFYLARHLARDGAGRQALETINNLAGEGFFCSTALRNDSWLKPLALLPGYGGVLDAVLRREAEARAAFEAAEGNRVLPKATPGA